ncbi:MAG TPA: hypothetical protein ENN49_03050 [Bacteroidales bacterium]|nr:hypothetical protein [Bacteroidales bacterium]
MFSEGEWYSFTVTKVIDLPGSGKQFVLTHESGKKLLLPCQFYVKYNISVNSNIKCRVDKINCTGQIFIEPAHPVYRIGGTYSFRIKQITHSVFEEAQNLTVCDIFDNEIEVLVPKGTIGTGQAEVTLKVLGIKKGVPILSARAKWDICPDTFSIGLEILLSLSKVVVIQSEEYYLLKATSKCIALLKVKHYKHYGFKEGIPIIARYRGTDSKGFLMVDPEHPFYKVGGVYQFEIAAIEEDYSQELDKGKVAAVYDRFGMKCGVQIEDASTYGIGKSISCRVLGYKKGRPQLEIVPV